MKRFLLLLASAGLCTATAAQTPTAGRIQYEVAQRVDPSQMRIVINGQQVKPGSPDFPTDLPDTRNFALTLRFAGDYAKEERETGAVRVFAGAPGAVPQTTNLGRPFEEAAYVDQRNRTVAAVVSLPEGGATKTYRADTPFSQPSGWQETTQTKKIAGYTCHKATVPYQKDTYTVWYTTELPFTYSPVRELLPARGVVLGLESQREQYRATKVEAQPVAEADVRPTATAEVVTAAQLNDLREKARANFRQRLMDRTLGN